MATRFSSSIVARLKTYHSFSRATLRAVRRLAKKQASYATYGEYFGAVNMPNPTLFALDAHHGVPVVDIHPKGAKKTLVLHLPMNNPLDTNQQYQLATFATLFPKMRVIGFGNPSGGKYSYKEQNLRWWERLGIASGLFTRPLVKAELEYLATQGITRAYHVGYSYGATKALIASRYAEQGTVKGVVAIERVSRSFTPFHLARKFYASFSPLEGYAQRTGVQTYIDARRDAGKGSNFSEGLRRPINVAIGWMLASISGTRLTKKVLRAHPRTPVTLVWGTASELVNDATTQRQAARLKNEFGRRVRTIRLEHQHHALANDIHLHAAIVHESLAKHW